MSAPNSTFRDHFSGHAQSYAAHRPTYPRALFQWLASIAPDTTCAWDCGTGNGQAAIALTDFFDHVEATDASAPQIAAAEPHDRVRYSAAPAEDSGLATASISLITVAQAAHWFDLPRFWQEVNRVGRPNAVAALWCYGLARIDPAIDAIVDHFYSTTVGPYWPAGREHIESEYRDLLFPFKEIPAPSFAMTASLTSDGFIAYLRTWSAVQRYLADRQNDPLRLIEEELHKAWHEDARLVSWPLSMRVGKITPG
jgi:SAM-dependent methyltransferase